VNHATTRASKTCSSDGNRPRAACTRRLRRSLALDAQGGYAGGYAGVRRWTHTSLNCWMGLTGGGGGASFLGAFGGAFTGSFSRYSTTTWLNCGSVNSTSFSRLINTACEQSREPRGKLGQVGVGVGRVCVCVFVWGAGWVCWQQRLERLQ
jgi:hypothetical protein